MVNCMIFIFYLLSAFSDGGNAGGKVKTKDLPKLTSPATTIITVISGNQSFSVPDTAQNIPSQKSDQPFETQLIFYENISIPSNHPTENNKAIKTLTEQPTNLKP